MEDATKKKRGRPTAFERTFGDNSLKAAYKSMGSNYDSDRAYTNDLYSTEGHSIATDHLGKEKVRAIFFTKAGNYKGKAILEQIGRMSLQNGYDRETCEAVLDAAVKAMEQGLTIRHIERWIRHGRTTGNFEPLEAASYIYFTDQEAVDAYEYLCLLEELLDSAPVKDRIADAAKAAEIVEALILKFQPKYLEILEKKTADQ